MRNDWSFHQGTSNESGSQLESGVMGGMCKYLPNGQCHQNMLVLGSTARFGSYVTMSNQWVMSLPATDAIGLQRSAFFSQFMASNFVMS